MAVKYTTCRRAEPAGRAGSESRAVPGMGHHITLQIQGPWDAAGTVASALLCLGAQVISKLNCVQLMLFMGLTFPDVQRIVGTSGHHCRSPRDQLALTLPEDLTPFRMHR